MKVKLEESAHEACACGEYKLAPKTWALTRRLGMGIHLPARLGGCVGKTTPKKEEAVDTVKHDEPSTQTTPIEQTPPAALTPPERRPMPSRFDRIDFELPKMGKGHLTLNGGLCSVRGFAHATDVHPSTVWKILKRDGGKTIKRGRYGYLTKDLVLALIEDIRAAELRKGRGGRIHVRDKGRRAPRRTTEELDTSELARPEEEDPAQMKVAAAPQWRPSLADLKAMLEALGIKAMVYKREGKVFTIDVEV